MVSKKRNVDSNRLFNILSRSLGNKRGQVTIFIIIGIIILFASAAIIYMTKTVSTQKITEAKEPSIASVPLQFQPIKIYTEDCLSQVGKQGLLVLGEQGGYIYPDLMGKFSDSKATDSEGIDMGSLKVPYWHYNMNPNVNPEVVYSSLKPKLYFSEDKEMSVEAQLRRFVNEKIDSCLNGYNAFEKEGFTVENTGAREVVATVGENNVNFLLTMPLKVVKDKSSNEMEQFYVKVPLQLKKYYETASEINTVEQNYSFLERQTLDLLATYSGVDMNKLPPMEGVTFERVPKAMWATADVKANVKQLLVSQVPLIRYYGSENFYRFEYKKDNQVVADLSELYQKNYDNTILPLESGKGLNINFDYFGWEPYFDVNDKGGVLSASTEGINYQVLQFYTNHYFTVYDLSYPVLVTLHDSKAFNGEGYNFVFAMEANVRNNQIIKTGYVQPAPLVSAVKSMVCDPAKRNTQLVKTVVVDSNSLKPLEAVQIGFSVPQQDDCMMGLTDSNGKLETKYPAVYGGVGSYIKEGYLSSFYPIDTYKFKNSKAIIGFAAVSGLKEKVVPLYKYKTIKVSVKKKMLEKCVGETSVEVNSGAVAAAATTGVLGAAWYGSHLGKLNEDAKCFSKGIFGVGETVQVYSYNPQLLDRTHSWIFSDVTRPLQENENGNIILKRVADFNPNVLSDEFTTAISVNGNETKEVDLVPGIYEVTGLLTRNENLVIPTEERCSEGVMEAIACTDLDGCCSTFPAQTIERLLEGQLQWDQKGMYLAITPEQLYGSQEITFYVLGFDEYNVPEQAHIRVLEDLQVMGQLGNFSRQLRGSLEPTYK